VVEPGASWPPTGNGSNLILMFRMNSRAVSAVGHEAGDNNQHSHINGHSSTTRGE
jgi:hypothetical protein